MKVGELLKLILSETFTDLAIETNVDFQVKKLSGEIMFKLILFSMLGSDKLSLRVMETYRKYSSAIDYYGGKGLIEIIKLDTLIV